MDKLYLFSGLGADWRVFKALDLSGFNVTHIEWIAPIVNERIEDYAKRISSQVRSEKPILIGLSFGGIMAIEVARHIEVEKLILIASAKTKEEIPFYYRWAGALKIHRLLPPALLKKPTVISNWLFGAETKEDKELLADILRETDPKFLVWAMDKIVSWKNTSVAANLQHIHGSKDRILPATFVQADWLIKGGGHLMPLNKAEEIIICLKQLI